jgi:hypothetical protein
MYYLVRFLPFNNFCLMKRLALFFYRLSLHGADNRMSDQNLATVLGPNILRNEACSLDQLVSHAAVVNKVALELIKNAELIFGPESKFFALNSNYKRVSYCCIARAYYSYTPQEDDDQLFPELEFKEGDIFLIIQTHLYPIANNDGKWLMGEIIGRRGKSSNERQVGLIFKEYVGVFWDENGKI